MGRISRSQARQSGFKYRRAPLERSNCSARVVKSTQLNWNDTVWSERVVPRGRRSCGNAQRLPEVIAGNGALWQREEPSAS